MAAVYLIVVQVSSSMLAMARLTAGSSRLTGAVVDLAEGVVQLDQHCPGVAGRAEQSGAVGQGQDEVRGDGVALAGVSEGERAQERTARGRDIGPVEHLAHRTMA